MQSVLEWSKRAVIALFISFLLYAILVNATHQLGIAISLILQKVAYLVSLVLGLIISVRLPEVKMSWKVPVLSWLLFVPLFAFILTDERFQISHHGFLHHHYVLQMLRGDVPENACFPGVAAPVYWTYHSILAIFSDMFQLASPMVNMLMNAFSLLMAFIFASFILREIGVRLNLKKGILYVYTGLFSLNILGWIYFIANMVKYDIGIFENTENGAGVDRMLKPTGHVQQMSSLLPKFFNYSGAPLGYAITVLSIYLALRFVKTRDRFGYLVVTLSAGILLHITVGAFSGLLLLLASVVVFSLEKQWPVIIEFLRRNIPMLLVAVVLLLLDVLYIREGTASFDAGRVTIASNPELLKAMQGTVIAMIVCLLLLCNTSLARKHLFLVVFATSGLALSMVLQIPIYNQYKAAHLASIAVGFLLVVHIEEALDHGNLLRKAVAVFVLLSVVLNIVVINCRSFIREWEEGRDYSFDGIHIQLANDYAETYYWIRENTPEDAVLLTPVQNVYLNDYQAIAERICYVTEDIVFSAGEEYWKRRVFNDQFFDKHQPAERLLKWIHHDVRTRPLYIVIPDRYEPYPMPDFAENLYRNEFVTIYRMPAKSEDQPEVKE